MCWCSCSFIRCKLQTVFVFTFVSLLLEYFFFFFWSSLTSKHGRFHIPECYEDSGQTDFICMLSFVFLFYFLLWYFSCLFICMCFFFSRLYSADCCYSIETHDVCTVDDVCYLLLLLHAHIFKKICFSSQFNRRIVSMRFNLVRVCASNSLAGMRASNVCVNKSQP